MLNQLNQLLKDKVILYRDLKALLEQEENVIEQGNISKLQGFLLKKEFLLKKLGNLEEKRKAVLAEIAQGLELPFEGISLLKIIKKTNGSSGAELTESRRQLIRLIDEISKLHAQNDKLVSRSSKSNGNILSFFNQYNKNYSYASSGKMRNDSQKRWMLNTDV